MTKVLAKLAKIVLLPLKLIYKLYAPQKKLNGVQKKALQKQWKHVQQISTPAEQIIEAEKVFVSTLKKLGFTGTFAEQWTQAEKRYGKNQAVWRAHKLRNVIVHEVGKTASKNDASFVMQTYQKQLFSL